MGRLHQQVVLVLLPQLAELGAADADDGHAVADAAHLFSSLAGCGPPLRPVQALVYALMGRARQ